MRFTFALVRKEFALTPLDAFCFSDDDQENDPQQILV